MPRPFDPLELEVAPIHERIVTAQEKFPDR